MTSYSADYYGGAIRVEDTVNYVYLLDNNTYVSNSAGAEGGAISIISYSETHINE